MIKKSENYQTTLKLTNIFSNFQVFVFTKKKKYINLPKDVYHRVSDPDKIVFLFVQKSAKV